MEKSMVAKVSRRVKRFTSAMCEVYLLSPNSDPNSGRLKHFGFRPISDSRATKKPLLDPLVLTVGRGRFHETIVSALPAVTLPTWVLPLFPTGSHRKWAIVMLSRSSAAHPTIGPFIGSAYLGLISIAFL
jgi:hypothetical protein